MPDTSATSAVVSTLQSRTSAMYGRKLKQDYAERRANSLLADNGGDTEAAQEAAFHWVAESEDFDDI